MKQANDQAFIDAAHSGELNRVATLLDNRADPNVEIGDREQP